MYLRPSGSKSDALHQPLMLGLHVEQSLRLRAPTATTARGLRPPNEHQPFQMKIESPALDAAEHQGDFLRDHVVHVADEAQRQMIILRIDPARARQSAAQHDERLADIGGNFDTGEETRHGSLTSSTRARRAREQSAASTCGRIRATITSTPAAFGCRPSA